MTERLYEDHNKEKFNEIVSAIKKNETLVTLLLKLHPFHFPHQIADILCEGLKKQLKYTDPTEYQKLEDRLRELEDEIYELENDCNCD
jgi:hypothetical protein